MKKPSKTIKPKKGTKLADIQERSRRKKEFGTLPLTCITYFEVDDKDLEVFATKVYGLKYYNFVATEECGNDSQHSFNVDGKLDEYEQEEANKVKETKDVPTYRNRLILNMLCADGFIIPGKYLVRVCW